MINIEGDDMIVIQALKGDCKGPWQITHIIEDVKACLHQSSRVFINHTFREANMVADCLSKFDGVLYNGFLLFPYTPSNHC